MFNGLFRRVGAGRAVILLLETGAILVCFAGHVLIADEGSGFSFDTARELARSLAAKDFKPEQNTDLPEVLKSLTYDQYQSIRFRPEQSLWQDDHLRFIAQFFSVATKQPANTAPALARRMNELHTPAQLEALVDEVVFLIRSQIASIFGNLALVIPATWIIDVFWRGVTGNHIVNEHKAGLILETVNPWNGCWFFAMFTGVLLWLSSLFAAWLDNWFVLHQLSAAVSQHRGLQRHFGPTRTRHLAIWLEHNIAGLGGNISLGVMLGIVPSVAVFFGLPLDVRHVTLSTGQVTAAYAALGGEHFWVFSTVWLVVGILGIGLLNILVSFSLALSVAIRARNLRGPDLHQFYHTIVGRFIKSPLSFLLPIGLTATTTVEPPSI